MNTLRTLSLAFLSTGFILTGCATGNVVNVQQQLDTWIGHDTDSLVRAWGAPDRSYDFKDGSGVMEYERTRIDRYGGWNSPHSGVAVGPNGTTLGIGLPLWMDEPRLDVRRCVVKFETSKRDIIRQASFRGQNCAYAIQNGMRR